VSNCATGQSGKKGKGGVLGVMIHSEYGVALEEFAAFGMGFGGNKESGVGEILNSADPLRPFTREDSYRRIAQNKDIKMGWQGAS